MFKLRKKFLTILACLVLLINIMGGFSARADEQKSYNFSAGTEFDYNSDKITFSTGAARLKTDNSPTWYDSAWAKRRRITITNNSATALSDYQVAINLTSANFDFDIAKSDGSDLVFTDTDGTTVLSHYTEAYNSVAATSTVWVKVPSITGSGTKDVYLYYGNSSATETSSADNTFIFYDSFDSLKTNTASSTDYFTTLSAGNTSYDVTYPHAQYYNGRTYVVYPGAAYSAFIRYYDHATQTWSDAVKIGDSSVTEDGHVAPSMLIDDSGYIHVFYGCHNSQMKYRRSHSPEDISSWDTLDNISDSATYPQPIIMPDGTIYVFYRAGSTGASWNYRTSTNHGASWVPETTLLSASATSTWYANIKPGTDGTLHLAFFWKDNTDSVTDAGIWKRYNVYYLKRNTGGTWENIDGTAVSVPFDKATADSQLLAHSSGASYVSLAFDLDSNNNPYIAYLEGSGTGASAYQYKFLKRVSGAWQVYDVGLATDHLFDSFDLDVVDANNMDLYAVTGGTPGTGGGDGTWTDRGGNIVKWHTTDGGATWSSAANIITYADTSLYFNNPQTVLNATSTAKVIFGQWLNSNDEFMTKNYLYGDSGFITANEQSVYSQATGAAGTFKWSLYPASGYMRAKVLSTSAYSLYYPTATLPTSDFIIESQAEMSSETFLSFGVNVQDNGQGYSGSVAGNAYDQIRIARRNFATTWGSSWLGDVGAGTLNPSTNTKYNITFQSTGSGNLVFKVNSSTISGTNTTYTGGKFGLLAQSGGSSANSGTITFYYLRARRYVTSEPTFAAAAAESVSYYDDSPTLTLKSAENFEFAELTGWDDTVTTGTVKYQLSNDGGSTWLWYNSGSWGAASSASESNTASEIESAAGEFPRGEGELSLKIFLVSDGSAGSILDNLMIDYIADATAPSGSLTINNGSNRTEEQTVTLNISASDDVSSAAEIQMQVSNSSDFSLSSWETWSTSKSWLLTDGFGDKNVYIKFKDAVGNTSGITTATINYYRATGSGLGNYIFNPPQTSRADGKTIGVTINNGEQSTKTAGVGLNLVAADDVKYVAIANDSNFTNANREDLSMVKEWNLCQGQASCVDGPKTVYVKFYTQWGIASDVYTDSIELKTVVSSEKQLVNEPAVGWQPPAGYEYISGPSQLKFYAQIITEPNSSRKYGQPKGQTNNNRRYIFNNDLYYGLQNNNEVRLLQERLISLGYLEKGLNTGNYLGKTREAIRKFQSDYKIAPVNGRFGPLTRSQLNNL